VAGKTWLLLKRFAAGTINAPARAPGFALPDNVHAAGVVSGG
jgi:hypothetical protein